ncbi:transporter substrate-binding domain-containing protein [Clostridium sediminicola]|uniref:basic amino acid ABC transporter substrate-binding protein n=1 Tax=Clostridium sediminicola TaxID=3114879 RepID=UPI0031F256A4
MNKLKKGLMVLMTSVMLVSIAGCSSKKDSSGDGVEKTAFDTIVEKGVLTVGNSPDYPPFETIDEKTGETVGFDIDLLNKIGEKIGVEIELKEMSFETIVESVKSGQVDVGCSGFSITPERLESVNMSDPYLSGGQVIVTTKDSGIKSAEDLNGEQVAVGIGSTCAEAAKEIEGAEILELDDFNVAFVMVKNNSVKATVADISVANEYLNNDDSFIIVGEPLTIEDTAIATKKGNDKLIEEINKAIKELKEDGTIDTLKEKWKVQ